MLIKKILFVVLLCSASFCQMNSCPGYNTGDLLQSGKNAIMRGKIGGNPEYSYEAPINFPIPSSGLEIAVTTGTIGDYNPLPNYGYNYYIEAGRKGNTNSIIYKLIMNNDQSWTSIQLSYLVTARSDLTIGNFQSPIQQWTTSGANVYTISKNIAKTLPKTSYKVAAFVSGFSTTDSQFSLTLTRKSYQVESKKLTVVFYSSANPAVLTVTISYIIYPQVHQVLDFSYDLTPKGDAGSYQISGPVNFQPNKRIQYNQWRVQNRNLPCTGNQCSNICVLRQQCAKLNGNIFENQCIFCPPGIVFQFGRCSKRCGLNQIYLNRVCICAKGFSRKGKDCIKQKVCGTNQIWSDATNSCICAKDCHNYNSQCRQCPAGSIPTADGLSCFCNSNDKIYDINSNTCKNRCTDNQLWSNNKCSCISQYSWWNQNCKKCPDNSLTTDDQSTCACSSKNSYFNPQTYNCVQCINGFVLNKAKSDCVCPQNYIVKNNGCVPNCSDLQIFNAITKGCQCKPGFIRSGKNCIPACPDGQIWNSNGCTCANGYVRIAGICKQCPFGSFVNDQKTGCICTNPNQVFATDKFSCITCIANSSPNQDKSLCVCNLGYVVNGGSCVRDCKDPQFLNVQTGNCDCKSGYTRDNGICKSRCQFGQNWDGSNCLCQPGYAKYGTCRLCPGNTLTNSLRTSCICTDPNQIFSPVLFNCVTCLPNSKPNSDLSKCVCNPGYILSGSNCILNCGLNQQPNVVAGRCDCIFGFHKVDGKCVPKCTGLNQQWNGNACICKPGHGIFNQVCTICPNDATANPSRTGCLCVAPNYIFNPLTYKCQQCPDNSHNDNKDSKCVCNPGFESRGNICSPICDVNQALNPKTNQCDCRYGTLRLGPICVQRCGLNQEWDGNKCICKQNFISNLGVCKPCPDGTQTNVKRTNCICKKKRQLFSLDKFDCFDLPVNSDINDDFTDYVCYPGYKKDALSCVNTCPSGAFPDHVGNCICGNGYYLEGSICKKPVSCPPRSTWNANSLACVCDTQGQNLINGQCQTCGQNSIFLSSTKQCVCNTGFFLIGGKCTICDTKTKYNGTDCVCNLGFFGNRDKCQSCHKSCSKCSGSQANQCQSCSDVSLVFQNGFCSKNSPCDPGFYLGDTSCTKCSDNCIICDDIFQCQTCAIGYQINKIQIQEQTIQACTQICGDGIKYQAECDDGNTKDGDGCSSTCTIQAGWSCSGGSSAQKSNCKKFIPDQTILTSKGVVNLGNKVLQSVRATYLPTCLTNLQCNKCFKVLQVNVINSNVPILVKVNYVAFSQYQFLVQYDFQGLVVTSKFKSVIKLNPDFKGCLADDDFDQQIQTDIDPAFLALIDQSDTLTMEVVNNNVAGTLSDTAKDILGVKKN